MEQCLAFKHIPYGTELVYKNKIIHYSTFDLKTGNHLCYFYNDCGFFPKTLSLRREQFKIRKSKENIEPIFEKAPF